jgi:endogenous inhibitor of DNA gyrase (YacG/DUF329 family)
MPERRCPVCARPVPPRETGVRGPRPFCSERCRQVDLGRWFTGAYAVPAAEEETSANDDS